MAQPYIVHRFPNGLTLALAPMPEMASVSVGLWVAVGGRHESAELNGASHFIEHMLFKGTRRRSARDISQAVEGLGGYLNAFTSEEHTCFYAKARHDRFAEVFDVLADMFLHSTFDPNELEKERAVIKEELAMYTDQPHHRVEELLNAVQWPDHPLGRPLTGSEETIASLTREDLLGYRRGHHVAPAVLVAVAGRLRPQECRRAAASLAARVASGPLPQWVPVPPEGRGPVVRLERRAGEQTQLALGVRTCSRHDDRRFALRLLNVVLGENMSSRLFQVLREDTGLAYSVASSLSFFEDAGDLVVAAGLETGNLVQALRLTVAEFRRLKSAGPDEAELRRARDYVIGQIDLSLENTEHQMMWLGEQLTGYGRTFSPAAVKRRLVRVTSAEVQTAARDFFRPDRLSLALVGPVRNRKGLPELLARV